MGSHWRTFAGVIRHSLGENVHQQEVSWTDSQGWFPDCDDDCNRNNALDYDPISSSVSRYSLAQPGGGATTVMTLLLVIVPNVRRHVSLLDPPMFPRVLDSLGDV